MKRGMLLESLLQTGILIVDPEQTVVYANALACLSLGLSSDQLIGEKVGIVVTGSMRREVLRDQSGRPVATVFIMDDSSVRTKIRPAPLRIIRAS